MQLGQGCSHAGTTKVKHVDGVAREESHVGCILESVCDVLGSLDLPDGDKTWTTFAHGVGDELSSFSLTLGAQHSSLGLFFALEHDELGTLGTLLSDLLGLNGASELTRELQVSDRDIIEEDVEFQSAFSQLLSDLL